MGELGYDIDEFSAVETVDIDVVKRELISKLKFILKELIYANAALFSEVSLGD